MGVGLRLPRWLSNPVTLRTQLLVALGLLAAVPVVSFGLVQSKRAEDAEVARADRETLLASTSLARELGRMMNDHAEVARSLAAEIGQRGALDRDFVAQSAKRYQAVFPGLYCVFVVDTEGVTVDGTVSLDGTNSIRSMAGTVYDDRSWFRTIVRGGQASASELLRSRVTGRPAVILSSRVADRSGTPFGLTGVGVDLGGVARALERVTEAAPGLAAVLFDDQGHVVAAAGANPWQPLEVLGSAPVFRPAFAEAPEPRSGVTSSGELRRGTVAHVQSDVVSWSILSTWPQTAVHQRGVKAIEAMVPFALISLVVGLALAVLLARVLARQLARLSVLVEAMGRGDLRVRAVQPGPFDAKEFIVLSAAIDGMLGQLQTLMQQIGRTAIAVRDVTRKLHDTSAHMADDSSAQREAVSRSSGAIVQIADSMTNVGTSVRGLTNTASHTASSILNLDRQIEEIAQSLRKLSETIDSVVVHVKETEQQVLAVGGNTKDLGKNVGQTDESLRGLIESINGVAARAEHGRALARGALSAAQSGRDAVEKTIVANQAIQRSFSSVDSAVNALAGRSESIGEVAGVLQQVMHATRLLGINASIIASEAGGDQGRRFSVVAERVRSMANETAASIEQITMLVASVQSDIRDAVKAVQVGQETVHAGERTSADAGVRLGAIIASSDEAEQTVQDIARATRDQVQRVRAVQVALEEVRAATARIEGAVETQRSAQRSVGLAIADVRSVGDDVRRSTEVQQSHSQEMTTAVSAMSLRFQAMAQAIEAQNRERDRIEASLSVFEGAAQTSVQFARELGEIVSTLGERLGQLERELTSFHV